MHTNTPPEPHHVVLTSHPNRHGKESVNINWGASTIQERGPIIASTTCPDYRNAIGTYSGSYSIYRALAIAAGDLDPEHRADLTNTAPIAKISPQKSWLDPKKIVSLDPFGHMVTEYFGDYLAKGVDIRPTIAVTKANILLGELQEAIAAGRLKVDGSIVKESGHCAVTKAAIEPVWHLPGLAQRFGCTLADLRRTLFTRTGGMFPELVTRPDLEVFLPPIGGITAYIFGDVSSIPDPNSPLNVRVHDECNGSDVFGSDICTCRPYLIHGIEVAIEAAQQGGAGIVVYNRKEGRALGEVTKFLVYNARKRQEGGDRASTYFERTECIAGVQDMRFQELMPDILHWFGITTIDKFVSMSNMKYDAIANSGITIKERVSIPDELIPSDAQVEMSAKKAAGYYTEDQDLPDPDTVQGKKFTP